MGASLGRAISQDTQPENWARYNDQNDMFAARLSLKEIGDAANGAYCSDKAQRDHRKAEYWFWNVGASDDSYKYTPDHSYAFGCGVECYASLRPAPCLAPHFRNFYSYKLPRRGLVGGSTARTD